MALTQVDVRERELLTVSQAAAMCGVSFQTLLSMLESPSMGRAPLVVVNDRPMLYASRIGDWVDEQLGR